MNRFDICTAGLSSMTLAMKAQATLNRAAIRCDVIPLSTQSIRKGCAYGIAFAAVQRNNVRTILSQAHIPVRSFDCGEDR